jgi:hypothetical protein
VPDVEEHAVAMTAIPTRIEVRSCRRAIGFMSVKVSSRFVYRCNVQISDGVPALQLSRVRSRADSNAAKNVVSIAMGNFIGRGFVRIQVPFVDNKLAESSAVLLGSGAPSLGCIEHKNHPNRET